MAGHPHYSRQLYSLENSASRPIVNTMGVSVAAAFVIVNRIDDFAYTPEQNIAHAMTALMAQNKGAGKKRPHAGGIPLRYDS